MLQQNQILDQTYQIINEIGEGGIGKVYLAWHLRLEKYVVLKQIKQSSINEYTRTEVDILKSLHHPNLPQVYDFIEMGDSVFTVMDYIEGMDLENLKKTGYQIPQDDMIRWFKQLADVLCYLHSREPAVIHSDIKPANIIITPQNDAVLIDFNVSLSRQTDTVIGLSLDYASPEQISLMQQQLTRPLTGMGLDGRSDIYSLCASFYFMISGIKPSVFYGTTPLISMETDYPEVFCQIIDKGMAIEREDRFKDAAELKRSLDTMWRRTAAFKRKLILIFAAGLAGIIIVAVVLFVIIKGARERSHEKFVSEYNSCIEAVNSGNSSAVMQCLDFLNNNKEALEKEPSIKAEVLNGLGECYYNSGRYEEAADKYLEAAETYNNDLTAKRDCYSRVILSYAQNHQMDKAQYYLEYAASGGISGDSLKLLQIQFDSASGNSEKCSAEVNSLMQSTSDSSILVRAFIAAAECEEDENSKLNWLIRASDCYNTDSDITRSIGYDMLVLGTDTSDTDISSRALEVAEKCYAVLKDGTDVQANDFLNLATIQRLLEKYDDCLATLDDPKISKILADRPGVIYMHKAFAYDAYGDSVRAMEFIRLAQNELLEGQASSEDMEQFNMLVKKYGL